MPTKKAKPKPTRRGRRHPLAPLAGLIRRALEADRQRWLEALPQPKATGEFSQAEFVRGYNKALADVRDALVARAR